MRNVLITGGSGQVGQRLTKHLESKGYEVAWLSRNPEKQSQKSFHWNPAKEELDTTSLEFADVIIHLAGSGIMDQRWTDSYKKVIIDSRILGLKTLKKALSKSMHKPYFISGAGISYYGSENRSDIQTEESPIGNGFIAEVCRQWEDAANELKQFVNGLSIVRIAVVMGQGMSGYEKMAMPIKMLAGGRLGSGNQLVPWIHINDLCRMFSHCIENKLQGTYNASFKAESQIDIARKIGKHYKRPLLSPPVPAFALRIILGEAASLLLNGYPTSNEKIISTGFEFRFADLNEFSN